MKPTSNKKTKQTLNQNTLILFGLIVLALILLPLTIKNLIHFECKLELKPNAVSNNRKDAFRESANLEQGVVDPFDGESVEQKKANAGYVPKPAPTPSRAVTTIQQFNANLDQQVKNMRITPSIQHAPTVPQWNPNSNRMEYTRAY